MACISSKQIPQELIDRIINELHDNRKSLESCKSVCWAFRSPAEAVLFRRVSFDSYRSGDLSRLFESSPHVFSSIREVTFNETVYTSVDAVRALAMLSILRIRCMTWFPDSYRIPAEVISAFATLPIRTLVLEEVIFRDIVHFSSFMDTFLGVEDISFKHVYCNLVSKNDNPPVSPRTNFIQSLELSVNEISSNVLRMVADGRLGSLTKLHSLTCVGSPKGKEILPLLSLVQNPSLQYLKVEGDIPVVNLSHINTLVIHLTNENLDESDDLITSFKSWTDCFAGAEELSLKKLLILLDLTHRISADAAKQWVMLDKVLLASRFPELTSLRVKLKAPAWIDVEQAKELIQSNSPTLCTWNVCTWEVEASNEDR
ncbi:uncharacterized protein ARMOST_15741 [Armillaria ostoyae]|uniref:F-box domain-containing protein n=1 Tax=Armillaria ostoyae TaxID=47428 RepID=A0A284RU65_ARMOS|nr:uncharacterized protein ARMOST_15741 [Armillaria ostoyae]